MATERAVNIELPYQWAPRRYQRPLWDYLEGGGKRACCVWHRRAGKDLTSMNWMVCSAMQRVGTYWHALPTYAQGRKTIWDGMTKDGKRFLDYIPPELISRVRDDEMKVWLRNGSILQVIGAEDPDRLVGANPIGVTLSEYSIQNPAFWDFVRPILAENGGWAVFIYTPRGRNHGFRLYERAKKNPSWFSEQLSVEDTGAISPAAIEEDRQSGMSDEMIAQEYYVSFDIALVGSYYGSHMSAAKKEGRIGKVPWEPSIPVTTGWDLGSANSTCIWFKQQVGAERRLIDFYRKSGEDLTHFAKVLQDKPYVYGKHFLPHDVEVKELSAKQSRRKILQDLGVKVTPIPRIGAVSDGIEVVRNYLRTCYFDEEKCSEGIQGLLEYVKKETGEQDAQGKVFYSEEPLHNWASDVADSMRSLACGDRLGKFAKTPSTERRGPSPYARRVAIV
jgi:phage terminase large subunit